MTNDMIQLARRAVASPHWRWMPGMLATHSQSAPARVLSVQTGEYEPPMLEVAWSWRNGDGVHPGGWLPDLTDPVTVEAVGILAREALAADSIDVRVDIAPRMDGVRAWWTARGYRMDWRGSGCVQCANVASHSAYCVDVRVACYVAALEAAPSPEDR